MRYHRSLEIRGLFVKGMEAASMVLLQDRALNSVVEVQSIPICTGVSYVIDHQPRFHPSHLFSYGTQDRKQQKHITA